MVMVGVLVFSTTLENSTTIRTLTSSRGVLCSNREYCYSYDYLACSINIILYSIINIRS
jgi:hypothetical protein